MILMLLIMIHMLKSMTVLAVMIVEESKELFFKIINSNNSFDIESDIPLGPQIIQLLK